MKQLLVFSILALSSACADCRDDGWSRYIGVHILNMPDNAASATLTVTSNALDVPPCTVAFEPLTRGTFGDVVDDSDCEGTMAGFTTGREWFVGYPVNRTFPNLTVSYEVVDTDGVASGFEDEVVRVEWSRSPFENGPGCAGDVRAELMRTQTGAQGWLP